MKRNTVLLIGALSFFACLLLIWELFILPKKSHSPFPVKPTIPQKQISSPTPTLPPTATAFPSITATIDPLKQKIINLLPIENEDFTIEYSAPVDQFIVIIRRQPIETYRKEAEQWFKDQGVKDLERFNILWGKTRGISKE